MVQCAVLGCCNRPETHKDLKFHRFPTKNVELSTEWNKICTTDDPRNLEGIKNKRICSKHFTPADYKVTPTGRLDLKNNAVPTSFRPEGIMINVLNI